MMIEDHEQSATRISELANSLQAKALGEAREPAQAVSALMAAAADILCMSFPPEVAASLIVQVTTNALASAEPLITATPAGRA